MKESVREYLATIGRRGGLISRRRLSAQDARNMAKVREAIAKPKHDEEIRQIAYHLWQEEGCPDGRHLDHWSKAESIWQARQEATQPDQQARAKTNRPRQKPATSAKTKSRAVKPKAVPSKEHPAQGTKEP